MNAHTLTASDLPPYVAARHRWCRACDVLWEGAPFDTCWCCGGLSLPADPPRIPATSSHPVTEDPWTADSPPAPPRACA